MPTTFKPVVYADNKRQDGTYNVKIRVTHRRQTLKLSTNMYVAAHQMTRALKLKDQSIIDEAKRIIDNWRAIVGRLGAAADVMTVRQVVDYIKQTEQNNMAFELDFIAYGRKKAETMRPGTGIGYQIALNALVRYIGTETLDISRINARFLTGFEQFIEAEPVLTHRRPRKAAAPYHPILPVSATSIISQNKSLTTKNWASSAYRNHRSKPTRSSNRQRSKNEPSAPIYSNK